MLRAAARTARASSAVRERAGEGWAFRRLGGSVPWPCPTRRSKVDMGCNLVQRGCGQVVAAPVKGPRRRLQPTPKEADFDGPRPLFQDLGHYLTVRRRRVTVRRRR